tara:strand:- start:2474 stop:3574 length:1101 start_codon:yes stop_codon:yes gene_type:complete
MNVILTGVTGTLGSQVLSELLRDKSIEKIYLLIRDKKTIIAKKRFQKIIESDIFNQGKIATSEIDKKVTVFNSKEFFTPSAYLTNKMDTYFIHSAGFVNLSTDISQRDLIFQENLGFAKEVFEVFSPYIHKFTYISTAFAIGDIGNLIDNNYHTEITPKYRNAYEESKHAAEKYLLKESRKKNIEIQILRPSVIGGNITSNPKNFISKFMVYYLVGKFFHKNPLLENNKMRISVNYKTGLNIVPVDYVAKVISKVFTKSIQQLNIVNRKCTNLVTGLTRIIETVGYTNFSFLDTVLTKDILDKNKLEHFYYSSIGDHLSPYTLSLPHEYDTKLLEEICPMSYYNLEDYLEETIKYAVQNNFRNEKW